MKQDSSSCLETTVNAVVRPAVSVVLEHGTPSISVRIEGEVRVMIIGTGSNISIVQPGLSKSEVRHTDMRPYGITGETLDVNGRQAVSFILGGREFNHQFLVCSLPTDADGLLGMDFLTPCRRATQKCVITVPCVDGSRISAFFTRRLAHAFHTWSGSLIASRLSPA